LASVRTIGVTVTLLLVVIYARLDGVYVIDNVCWKLVLDGRLALF
jgi:hypothetical protein